MKKYTTIKVGYTTGIYGCSGEYFNTIIIDGDITFSVAHYGMYGSDERVNAVLRGAGYGAFYVPTDYGKMTKRDVWKGFISEYDAIDKIKYILEYGEYPND